MGQHLDLRLARLALRRLGCGAHLRRVATGLDTVFRADLDDGRRLAVRVAGPFAFRRPEATLMEAAWVRALALDTGLSVPAVLAPVEDDPFVVTDAQGRDRGVIVLAWLPGRKMRWRFTEAHARALGAVAAHLHRHAPAFVPPARAWAKTSSPTSLIGSDNRDVIEAVAGRAASATIDRALDLLDGAFRALGDEDWTLVNGDLGPHNAVWLGHRPGLFDFNDLRWGYTGADLRRYLQSLRWRPRGERLAAAALEGYETVAPLPVSSRRYGHLFEAAAGLFLADYLAGRVSVRGDDAIRAIRDVVARAEVALG